MIKSMTGYGKVNFINEDLNFDIEIKSINSRYLDLNIRIPNQLNFLEDKITREIKSVIKRGRVDVFIRTKSKSIGNSKVVVDEKAVIETKKALDRIKEMIDTDNDFGNYNLNDLFINNDVIKFEPEELEESYLEDIIISNLNDALSQLNKMRVSEGENLFHNISDYLDQLESYKNQLIPYTENIKEEIKEKLLDNLKEYLEDERIDNDRLYNELIYYADKADISEELDRLDSHFKIFRQSLNENESVGKKLDFITQEFLRETNTIASKSSKIEITNLAVEMKSIIEKIKEQVQNIE